MGKAQDMLDELEETGHCINHAEYKWFQRADIERIVVAMRRHIQDDIIRLENDSSRPLQYRHGRITGLKWILKEWLRE